MRLSMAMLTAELLRAIFQIDIKWMPLVPLRLCSLNDMDLFMWYLHETDTDIHIASDVS